MSEFKTTQCVLCACRGCAACEDIRFPSPPPSPPRPPPLRPPPDMPDWQDPPDWQNLPALQDPPSPLLPPPSPISCSAFTPFDTNSEQCKPDLCSKERADTDCQFCRCKACTLCRPAELLPLPPIALPSPPQLRPVPHASCVYGLRLLPQGQWCGAIGDKDECTAHFVVGSFAKQGAPCVWDGTYQKCVAFPCTSPPPPLPSYSPPPRQFSPLSPKLDSNEGEEEEEEEGEEEEQSAKVATPLKAQQLAPVAVDRSESNDDNNDEPITSGREIPPAAVRVLPRRLIGSVALSFVAMCLFCMCCNGSCSRGHRHQKVSTADDEFDEFDDDFDNINVTHEASGSHMRGPDEDGDDGDDDDPEVVEVKPSQSQVATKGSVMPDMLPSTEPATLQVPPPLLPSPPPQPQPPPPPQPPPQPIQPLRVMDTIPKERPVRESSRQKAPSLPPVGELDPLGSYPTAFSSRVQIPVTGRAENAFKPSKHAKGRLVPLREPRSIVNDME